MGKLRPSTIWLKVTMTFQTNLFLKQRPHNVSNGERNWCLGKTNPEIKLRRPTGAVSFALTKKVRTKLVWKAAKVYYANAVKKHY